MPRFSRTPFEVSTDSVPGLTRLILVGELDLATAPLLAEAIEAAEETPTRTLLLDFKDLTFIDGTGLRVLLAAARRAQAAGRTLQVSGARAQVRRLFELTAIDHTVELVGTPA